MQWRVKVGKRIRTRDYAMVRIIQGVTKSGPHRSKKEYNRQQEREEWKWQEEVDREEEE